mmetsp:Transcript_35888/g.83790  ORF Transcript_35888/g.83790 Transcript_35888/m.83790 type:complete len:241 (+) Transcript_35888:1449-2171(+)
MALEPAALSQGQPCPHRRAQVSSGPHRPLRHARSHPKVAHRGDAKQHRAARQSVPVRCRRRGGRRRGSAPARGARPLDGGRAAVSRPPQRWRLGSSSSERGREEADVGAPRGERAQPHRHPRAKPHAQPHARARGTQPQARAHGHQGRARRQARRPRPGGGRGRCSARRLVPARLPPLPEAVPAQRRGRHPAPQHTRRGGDARGAAHASTAGALCGRAAFRRAAHAPRGRSRPSLRTRAA